VARISSSKMIDDSWYHRGVRRPSMVNSGHGGRWTRRGTVRCCRPAMIVTIGGDYQTKPRNTTLRFIVGSRESVPIVTYKNSETAKGRMQGVRMRIKS